MLLVRSKELKSLGNYLIKTGGYSLSLLFFPSFAFAEGPPTVNSAQTILSIFLSLLVVIGIIFSLAYLLRRFNVVQSHGQLKVVASLSAGTREKIMVVQVGDEQHLVGVTSQNINHLSKLDTPLNTKAETVSTGESFKEKLVLAMANKINPSIKGKNDE